MASSSKAIEMNKRGPAFVGIKPTTSSATIAKRKRDPPRDAPPEFRSFERMHKEALLKMVHNLDHPDMPACVTTPWRCGKSGQMRTDSATLRSMLARLNDEGVLPCTFTRSRRCDQLFGRIYPNGGVSLQGIGRQVRHTLAAGLYLDIDAVNCQFALLLQYLDRTPGAPRHELLRKYVENRAAWLSDIMDATGYNRDRAKGLLTASLFGGSDNHKKAMQDACRLEKAVPAEVDAFIEREIPTLFAFFEAESEDAALTAVQDYIATQPVEKGAACKGARVMSTFLGHIESLCLFAGHDFCLSVGLNMESWVPIHDGFMVPIDEMERAGFLEDGKASPDFLARLQAHILKAEKYSLEFVEKPLDEAIDLSAFSLPPPPPEVEVVGVRDLLTKSRGTWTYERTKKAFEAYVYKLRLDSGFQEILPDGTVHVYKKRQDFIDAFEHFMYTEVHKGRDEDGEETEETLVMPFTKRWLKDPAMRAYERCLFAPPFTDTVVCEGDMNLWKGAAAERMVESGVVPTPDGEELFKSHVRMLCGDEDNARYIEMWFAQILQRPGVKSGISVSLVGAQGCGKSWLGEDFPRRLFGESLFAYTANVAIDVFSKHSTIRENALFLNIDESPANVMHKNADLFKSMVTQKKGQVEHKFMDQKTVDSYTRYMITTNNEDGVVRAQDGVRRDFIIHCLPTMVNNTAYFNDLFEWVEKDGNIVATYNYLMGLNVDCFDFSKKPSGEGMDKHRFQALPTPIQYLVCAVLGPEPNAKELADAPWINSLVTASDLRIHINMWVEAKLAYNKDANLHAVGERGISNALGLLIKSGAVVAMKSSVTVFKFKWDAVIAQLARYLDMHNIY